ncbi:hypothetical protein, partial [Streptococcus pneumoniae]|uniref:hypothetical protein n=1 Tax=Streptococcus pneumoniae TaxID=1313 RepID=UPI0018B04917
DDNSPTGKVTISATTADASLGLLRLNLLSTSGFKYGLIVNGNTGNTANRFFSFRTEADSIRLQEGGGDYTLQTFGAPLVISSGKL